MDINKLVDFAIHEYWFVESIRTKGLQTWGDNNSTQEYQVTADFLHKQSNMENFIEIGSAWGASFHIWASIVSGKKISIDIKPELLGNTADVPDLTSEHIHKRNGIWNKHFDNVHALEMNSHDQSTVDAVSEILNGDLVSWLYIDGDHSYESCKSDFEMYKQFVRPGGYIGFHDIPLRRFECGRFWHELKQQNYNWWEMAGIIGVVQV